MSTQVSVFDIHFRSPLVRDIPSCHAPAYGPRGTAPARRIVFFMADGLRADAFFRISQTRLKFLHGVMTGKGAFGVLHARVPTESRPGMLALTAGIYEDPSAVMT